MKLTEEEKEVLDVTLSEKECFDFDGSTLRNVEKWITNLRRIVYKLDKELIDKYNLSIENIEALMTYREKHEKKMDEVGDYIRELLYENHPNKKYSKEVLEKILELLEEGNSNGCN